MKKRQPTIGLVERAVIARKWHDFAWHARVNTLIGDSAPTVINYVGRMVYVALGCAMATGIDPNDVDVRVLRGTANTLHDQIGNDDLVFRQALQSGVEAAMRIADCVGTRVLAEQILKMEIRLQVGHLKHSDFLEAFQ